VDSLLAVRGREHGAQIGVGIRVIRTYPQSLAKLRDRLFFVVLLRQYKPYVVVGLCKIRPQTSGRTEFCQYFFAIGSFSAKQ